MKHCHMMQKTVSSITTISLKTLQVAHPALLETVMRPGRLVETEEPPNGRAAHDVLVPRNVVEECLQAEQTIVEETAVKVIAKPALGWQR